ncbi:MAG: DEAD/DEAH box helicase family protein [Ornithinimicrobium sp.]
MPTPSGKGFIDYVLWGDNGLPLAIIEAKRSEKDPAIGQQQARPYADCPQSETGRRSVIFFTNGHQHWIWDDAAGYPSPPLSGFFTKDELELMVQRRQSRLPLKDAVIDQHIVERCYQLRALRAVGEAFEAKQREALLVMATGSGKTRAVVAFIDQLMKRGWVKRVLFLPDRRALVTQAVGVFKTHLPSATTVNLVTEKNPDGRVFVSTYPTMMGLIDGTDGSMFGPGYFDLIIIDEAHRSVYQKYRAIFDWFDSLLVGLTATPKDDVDRNTYSLFSLEDGVPTDAYSLTRLSLRLPRPTGPISMPVKFLRDGIRYKDLSEADKAEWDSLEWDDDGVTPTDVAAEEINRRLFNADTADKVDH